MLSDQQTHIPDTRRPGGGSECKCVFSCRRNRRKKRQRGGENPCEASSGRGGGGDNCSERIKFVLQACCQLTVCCQRSDAATINISASPPSLLSPSLPARAFLARFLLPLTVTQPSLSPSFLLTLSLLHPMLSKICWRSRWMTSVCLPQRSTAADLSLDKPAFHHRCDWDGQWSLKLPTAEPPQHRNWQYFLRQTRRNRDSCFSRQHLFTSQKVNDTSFWNVIICSVRCFHLWVFKCCWDRKSSFPEIVWISVKNSGRASRMNGFLKKIKVSVCW